MKAIFDDPAFSAFTTINVLPLIYDEKSQRCNISSSTSYGAIRDSSNCTRVGRAREKTPGL